MVVDRRGQAGVKARWARPHRLGLGQDLHTLMLITYAQTRVHVRTHARSHARTFIRSHTRSHALNDPRFEQYLSRSHCASCGKLSLPESEHVACITLHAA